MNKTVLMLLGCCLLVATATGLPWWLHDESKTMEAVETPALPSTSEATLAMMPATTNTQADMATGLEGLPRSLAGTEVNCALETDAEGRLRITIGLRHCFDYFLAAVGEESIDTLTARIRAQLRHRLQEPALGEAKGVLEGYLAYLRGVADIEKAQVPTSGQMDLERVRQQMEQVRSLRTQYLSPEVIAVFFGDDDAYDLFALARLELLQNKTLSPQARAQQLKELEQQLPEDIQASLEVTHQYLDLRTLTDDWKQRAGSAEELRQIRTSLVGEEATARLEALDQENAAWDRRMNAWYAQRDAILSNTGLSQEDRERQLDDLRESRFSNEAERLRAETLERIHDQAQPVSMRPSDS
ncbi:MULTISPECIES: lipase secretion chaperone [unclassified Pseudomonas]|uniref:lipase secretion chaperone n=1 Tax=unclassified Pseudomonas TaxID=196821 RepID=UPI00244A9DC9|nr:MULTISPECIES: lipase secretion chaperone [unclassified Pseudomonas]MDG9925811.1 lipase secretion chaperone [Pseudomonas sp. GD04045]MDH0037361.1 lipase secretion chaperone [Pseudomonas sp. GD04019]